MHNNKPKSSQQFILKGVSIAALCLLGMRLVLTIEDFKPVLESLGFRDFHCLFIIDGRQGENCNRKTDVHYPPQEDRIPPSIKDAQPVDVSIGLDLSQINKTYEGHTYYSQSSSPKANSFF